MGRGTRRSCGSCGSCGRGHHSRDCHSTKLPSGHSGSSPHPTTRPCRPKASVHRPAAAPKPGSLLSARFYFGSLDSALEFYKPGGNRPARPGHSPLPLPPLPMPPMSSASPGRKGRCPVSNRRASSPGWHQRETGERRPQPA